MAQNLDPQFSKFAQKYPLLASQFYINVRILTQFGTTNRHYNEFRLYSIHQYSAIKFGFDLHKLDGATLRTFLECLENTINNMINMGVVPNESMMDDANPRFNIDDYHTEGDSNFLAILNGWVITIQNNFKNELDCHIISLDTSHHHQ